MKKNNIKAIEKVIISTIAEEKNIFLVGAEFSNEKHSLLVEIFVDTDDGISLDKCAKLSRNISSKLEEQNFIESAYNIMVSSPGLTRPLTHNRQFNKYIGKDLIITYSENDKIESDTFKLLNFDDTSLSIENKNKEIMELERHKIKSTIIKLKW